VFARSSILEPRLLRFSRQSHVWDPRWYKPRWPVFQPRRGGRMAVAGCGGRLRLSAQRKSRAMLYFRMRDCKVVRFSPRRAAAP
jgi:hypothetical protein